MPNVLRAIQIAIQTQDYPVNGVGLVHSSMLNLTCAWDNSELCSISYGESILVSTIFILYGFVWVKCVIFLNWNDWLGVDRLPARELEQVNLLRLELWLHQVPTVLDVQSDSYTLCLSAYIFCCYFDEIHFVALRR